MNDLPDPATRLKSPTGASVNLYHAPARGDSRAILLVQHGLAEHAGRYRRFMGEMAARGLHVYAHDHRGHGATTAQDAPLGRFAETGGWRKVIADLMAVREAALRTHPGMPVVLFGHSLGGIIALNALISHPDAFDAIAIWNSNLDAGFGAHAARAILATERMLKGSDVASGLLPRLTFEAWGNAIEDRRTAFDWLSHDRSEVTAYIDDPLCGFDPTVSMWQDVFYMIERGGRPSNWRHIDRNLPIHLLGGGKDPGTDYGKAMVWLADRMHGAGFNRITLTVEEALRHETLNELGSERPIANFATWVDRVIERNGQH
jgi:alpha-beta hydrolase superfamily lysophospholipase